MVRELFRLQGAVFLAGFLGERIFDVDEKELLIHYLSDRLLGDLKGEEWATDALKVAEKKIRYMSHNKNEE
ncbi:MAG: hypothetical protein IPN20_16600 [Haliscomenobacter sp.]|nr:hypothetical protein [Haliscomenobacter sp.]